MTGRALVLVAVLGAGCSSGGAASGTGGASPEGGLGGSSGGGSNGTTGLGGGSGAGAVTGAGGGGAGGAGAGGGTEGGADAAVDASAAGMGGAGGGTGEGGSSGSGGTTGPSAGKYDWLQFGFSQDKMANLDFGHFETTVSAANVAKLTQLFQVPIPDAPDGAPVALSDVDTPMGKKDLVYVVGQHGLLTAFDASNGHDVWHAEFTATGYSNSAPAIEPNRRFIYVNTADGFIHKLQVGDGVEVKGGGWPIANGGGKPSGQLAIGTDQGGTSYLYATNNGHGHATVVNLTTGSVHVFNLACSNVPDMQGPPGCDSGANPWARSPVFVADLQRAFIGTGTNDGSGQWIAGKVWRTSWVALPPDGHTTMMAGGGFPVDSYTPADWSGVVKGDRDTSVGGLIPLPAGYSSKFPHLAVQPGKDGNVRLINLADMSGMGGPGHTGGELGQVGLGLGLLRSWGAVWVNPSSKAVWVFIGGARGLGTVSIDLDAAGTPKLGTQWSKPNGWTTAPFIANGILYATNNAGERTTGASPHLLEALDPATGNQLWAGMVGEHHWSSPIIFNGVLYMADGNSGGCDVANGNPNCTPAGNTGHFTAFALK